MSKESQPAHHLFEDIKQVDANGEYWSARKLSEILDYSSYRNFIEVMKKAWEACKNSGERGSDHFVAINNMVKIGSGAIREITDVRLTRYACYLIVQNADPAKEIIALGQTYFAIQTRIQEIQQMEEYNRLQSEDERRLYLRKELTEHNKYLASAAKGAGVIDPIDYAVFQNYGYRGLYGGLDSREIKHKKGLPEKSNILDHMGSTELAANLFRATQTEDKLKQDKIKDKATANKTHYDIGKKVRKTIQEIGGTMPEQLPVVENIKKVEDKVKKTPPPAKI